MTSSVPKLLRQAAPHLSDAWRTQYIDQIVTWFEIHRRDLPWRKTSDPYAIWISESMLQQTQVATVIDYYQRFMVRFPTVDDLAAADESEVLGMWAGLGYYRRARQLHAAARVVVEEHASQFPRDVQQLMKLPGIGRYTAGAIASIAHGLPAPIVEANTQRLYARLLALEDELQAPRSQELLWSFAEWQLATQPSGTINQAAMELGSLICKPTSPQCLVCRYQSSASPPSKACNTAYRVPSHPRRFQRCIISR